MKSKKLKLSVAKILTVVSIVGMIGVAIGPKLGLEVCQVHAEGPGDGTNDKCLTQEEAVKLVQDEKNYSHDEQGHVVFTIPDNYDSIAPDAFNHLERNQDLAACPNWENVHTIVVGSKVEKIGDRAFRSCEMHKIVLPKEIKSIGKEAFRSASRLTEITIPEYLTSIPEDCFAYCWKLEKVNFVNSANIKSIGDRAFWFCSCIQEFTVPANVGSIPASCFGFCGALRKINFADPSKIQSIEHGAFSNCSSMQEITIPENIGSIPSFCFCECRALEKIDFANPNNIKSIEKYAFCECINLQQFTIPGNVKTISHACFFDCESLRLNIPDNIQHIEPYSLVNCKKIFKGKENPTLGEHIRSFSLDSFSGTGVSSIEVLGQNLNVTMTHDSFGKGPLPQIVYFSGNAVINFYTTGDLGEQVTRFFVPANTQFNIISQK